MRDDDLPNGGPPSLVEKIWTAIFDALSIEEIAALSELRKADEATTRPIIGAISRLAAAIERHLPPPEQAASESEQPPDNSGLKRLLGRMH
jgi:hypothetical protein